MDRAEKIMEEIDPKDSPFLAVGLSLKVEGIWSED
jgi:predicted nucleic acid-binding protein